MAGMNGQEGRHRSQSSVPVDNVADGWLIFMFCFVAQTHLNVEATPRLARPSAGAGREKRRKDRDAYRGARPATVDPGRFDVLLFSSHRLWMPLTFWQFLIKQTTINAFKLSAAYLPPAPCPLAPALCHCPCLFFMPHPRPLTHPLYDSLTWLRLET